MDNILNGDFFRIGKSKLFYVLVATASIIALILVSIIRQDIRLGISIFGDLTAFKGINDIVRIGLEYHKGLGIFVAVFISIFIGQEYQWNTWQHKWIACKSRTAIYLSKAVISSVTSSILFMLFEMIVLLGSGQMNLLFTTEYVATMLCGIFLYVALGSVICMFSMLIRSNVAASIVCLCYVVFSETFVLIIKNNSNAFPAISKIVIWCTEHTVYSISTTISSTSFQSAQAPSVLLNAVVIIIVSTSFGLLVFRKYEL